MERGPDGDFRVDLEQQASAPLNPANSPTDGLVEAELRAIFGKEVSGFKLEEKLGQGSFGIVFKATVEGGREVAIKFVRTDKREDMLHDVKINNEILRIFGNTQYESLFSLPIGMLKIKRQGQGDQIAFIFDKME